MTLSEKHRARVGLAASIFVVTLGAMFASGPAAMASAPPAWRIASVSEPTHLGLEDETLELKVKATHGEFGIAIGNEYIFVPYDISAAELQSTLESEYFEKGNLQITGGPGDADGSKPYLIKIVGRLTGQELEMAASAGEAEEAKLKIVKHAADGGTVTVTAINVGGPTDGSPVTVSDLLPAGLKGVHLEGSETYNSSSVACEESSPTFTCRYTGGVMETGDRLNLRISTKVEEAALPGVVVNKATVSGGGAELGASLSTQFTLSNTPAAFGVAPQSFMVATTSQQAGAHADTVTSFSLATSKDQIPVGNVKDVLANLPPGLVGNTVGMPRCATVRAEEFNCPRDTIVGVASITLRSLGLEDERFRPPTVFVTPIFNIEPSPGEPAAFMFTVVEFPVRLDTSVLSDGNYAVRVTAADLSEADPILSSTVTVWGVPADHQGPGPIKGLEQETFHFPGGLGGPSPGAVRVPLLTNPTQCSGPLTASIEVDEWGRQGKFTGESASLGGMTGCGSLVFSGAMSMLPDTLEAGAPAGYDFNLHVPQANDPDGLSLPNVKKVVTTLPMGTVVSPSSAVGLKACSDEQFYGPASARGLQQPAVPGNCPRESQVGTVSIRTPALELPLTGDVYLATPDCEPCSPEDAQDGKMIRLFVQVVGEGESGIVVKLEGRASLNQQTGQLTATFDDNPQLPFSDFKLTLGGGSRATLANPRVCGPVSTNLDMTPWSSPFTTDLLTSSAFEIDQGCISPRFDPSFVAGTTNLQAGEYTPFTLSFGREDKDEFLNGLQMRMPAGLLGSLSGVTLCKEPEASAGTCPASSLIGHVQVLTGPGQTPFLVTGGQVFLTDGYKGAPYGLSVVVPAKAGPFTLSGTTGTGSVVVRAAINVDPHTVALTVTSDPLPTALDGIPLQLKVVNVTIDRPRFTLNPTSCAKMQIAASLSSKESGGARASSPFQVTNCAGLHFKPQFKVSTSGRTSRKNGASLDAKLSYPVGNGYANIAKVKVDLPKQLPSRLTTLQKACPARTFEANPVLCPRDSVVGIARATTPILPVQLTGPAYFVSHGGEAFPNLVIVLQGYGVRADLIGDTFINERTNVTSSTFDQIPDVPVTSFELYLPQGPDSALAANGNLCNSNLKMPTLFVAQNGLTIHQTTHIATTGCGKAKARRARRAAARRARATRSRGGGAKPGVGHGANRREK